MADPGRLSVLQLLPALHAGGVERGTLEVAAALGAAGHRPLVASAGGRLVAELEAAGGQHFTLPLGAKSPLTLLQVPRLRALIRAQRVDIVHARSRLPAWVAVLALRGLPAPLRPHLVTTVHGLYSVNRYSGVMTRAARVIAVSRTVREYIARHYPDTDPRRVVTIARGVDDAAYPRGYRPPAAWLAAFHERHPGIEGKFVITLAARLTRLKGHEDLLSIVRALRAQQVPVHALVVGEGGGSRARYARALAAAARDLPVSFLGHRSDLREIYAVSGAVLSLSTRPESFGRTVLEALCLGRPVVGYAHGGVGEILESMFPEGAVALGDRAAAVRRLAAFAAAPPAVDRPNAFPLSAMLERTLSLYAELASSPR